MGVFDKNEKKEAGAISTTSGEVKKEAAAKPTMVNVTFLVDHGSYKKGDDTEYHSSTAAALVAHKIVEVK